MTYTKVIGGQFQWDTSSGRLVFSRLMEGSCTDQTYYARLR